MFLKALLVALFLVVAETAPTQNDTVIVEKLLTEDGENTGLWVKTSSVWYLIIVFMVVMSGLMLVCCALQCVIRSHYKLKAEEMIDALEAAYKKQQEQDVIPSPFALKPDEAQQPIESDQVAIEPATMAAILHFATPGAFPPLPPPVENVSVHGSKKPNHNLHLKK